MTGTTVRVDLTPRDISAQADATCSDVSLGVDVTYETGQPPSGTAIQRRIEALVRLPSEASSVSVGGLELTLGDGIAYAVSAYTPTSRPLNSRTYRWFRMWSPSGCGPALAQEWTISSRSSSSPKSYRLRADGLQHPHHLIEVAIGRAYERVKPGEPQVGP